MAPVDAIVQVSLFLAVLLALVKPLGTYMARAVQGRPPGLTRIATPLEAGIYRLARIDPGDEMDWKAYAMALLLFNLVGVLALYLLQRCQALLPLNPQHFPNIAADSAFNTAISFVTNTSWQSYVGEATMSHLSQMLGIGVQSFLSAASGMAVLLALIRGLARHDAGTIGNAWADITRSTLYILLPLSFVFALVFAAQGVIQNFEPDKLVQTLQPTVYQEPRLDALGSPVRDAQGQPVLETKAAPTQTLAMGPVASQEAIKLLSGDGGGFFNANSAHPYENPTGLTNLLQMLAILLIPASLCYTFGLMVGDKRQGWAVLAAMVLMFVPLVALTIHSEQAGNPVLARADVDQAASALQSGGNMEGKETRFGIVGSALFATVTTSGGDGAVNAMHDSFMPLGGLVPLALMQTGEVVFGGPGSGLFSMLIYALLTVFVSGLMIGRTPEYLGKRIEIFEMKMAAVVILVTPLIALSGTAIAVMTPAGIAGVSNPGAHGFSEILYAFSSAANNNGSAFAGLSANTPFYNVMLAAAMWFGRFGVIVPVLAIAGALAAKRRRPPGIGTLPTHGPLFVVLLIGAVVLIALLNYIPALALGPGVEHVSIVAH
jgi:K+-transporting ATPase ATPase A chain